MTYCNIHNSLQNSEPLSDKTAIGMPLLQNSFTNEAATEVALLSGKENDSVRFENKSATVKIIEFPSGVIGSGAIKSIPSISQVR